MKRFRGFINKLRSLFLILVIATGQVATASGPFLSLQKAAAAPICVSDTAGANDEPGQKDLTKLCVDYAGVPTTVATTWNWDDLGTSGANTLDACNLFDTDGDGNINYAVCVTTENTPATLQTLTTYSCGDAKIDRCTSTAAVISSGTTSCSVSQQSTDPFPTGNGSPVDTQGACTIQLSTVGGAAAKLIDVCSFPSAQPNSDPSDCVIAREDFGKVELIKDIVPNSDTGLFNLIIDGPEASDTITVNNQGDGGTTGERVVKKGTVIVKETAGTSTALSSYDTTIVCRDLNGTGSIIGSASPTGTTSRQLSFTLAEDADVVCTITNTRQTGTITLIKSVVNNNGGTAGANDFGLTTGGTSVTSGQTLTLAPGSYAINEAGLTGYSFVNITGTGCPAQLGGNVTLANGQNITCTITNDDIAPQLTVTKHVVTDNGGGAAAGDFTMNVTATNPSDSSFPGDESGTTITLDAGSYSVDEDAVDGYAKTLGANCSGSIAIGEHKYCTITNDDQAPSLTLNKLVSNTHGGDAAESDWTLTATGPTPLSGAGATGDTDVVSGSDFSAGTYTLSESTGPEGYSASLWTCTNNVTVTNAQITLANGQTTVCTITNTDIAPVLQLMKQVINDDGGTFLADEWTLTAQSGSDTPIIDEQGTSSDGGETALTGTAEATAGLTYTLSELGPDGYTPSTWSCDGGTLVGSDLTLSLGEVVICTITNDDQQAYIIVDKTVVNDNGGSAVADDFSLTVDSNAVLDEVAYPVNPGTHTAGEASLPGYTAGAWGGDCAEDATVTVALGETKTCTITNDDDAPSLTLVKTVTNDNGGQRVASEWTLTATGGSQSPTNLSGAGGATSGSDFKADTYTLDESGPSDYTEGTWGCDNQVTVTNNQITLTNGQSTTCTITNDDDAPSLTLVKEVVNDNGGTADASAWTLTATGPTGFSGAGPSVSNGASFDAGTYDLSESGGTAGYTASDWDCEGGTQDDSDTVMLGLGESATCTITNDDQAPSLTLNKLVSNTHGGDAAESDWTLTATGPTPLSGAGATGDTDVVSGSDFSAGTYTLSESTGPEGYSASLWTCTNNVTVTNSQIALTNGQTTVCTITNTDIAPTLTVTKLVLNPFGNPLLASAFPLFVDSTSVTSGVSTTQFDAGSYTISETQQTGYEFTGIDGDCTLDDDIISIVLNLGGSYTCTITNTAIQPKLIVIKHVINDNGGEKNADDFTMTVGGNSQVVKDFPGEESPGTTVLLNEGSYAVDELADDGYTKSLSSDCSGTIAIGETKTCTITNDDIAPVLTLKKEVDSVNPAHQASDWTLTATPTTGDSISGNGEDGVDEEEAVSHMTYTLSEVNNSDGTFDASEWECTSSAGVFSHGDDGLNNQIRMSEGANVTCVITNTERATVIVTKYNDFNRNGQYDPGETALPEPPLPGWEFNLNGHQNCEQVDFLEFLIEVISENSCQEYDYDQTQTTGEDGITTFTDIKPGIGHELSETPQDGWHLSNIHCNGDERGILVEDEYYVYAEPGETVECFVGNYHDVELTLTKSNNRPNPTTVGDTVTYTLVASLSEQSGALFDATVTDLPPAGFNYVPGSWTAVSNFRGDLKAASITTEPTYSSPGTWILGDMLPGEVVTLTYLAKIAASVSDGTYPDVAFAQGCALPPYEGCPDEEVVLSNVHFADNPFVATQVTVKSPQVLGASTTVLVNTGSPIALGYAITAMILMVLGVATAKRRNPVKGGAK